MIEYMETKSELYNTLAELGALCTEDQFFQEARSSLNEQFVKYYPISYDDIYDGEDRIGYFNPHFRLDIGETGIFEVWVNGEYINHDEITWVQGPIHLYGVLPRQYDIETTVVKVVTNHFALDRYTKIRDSEGDYIHIYSIDTTEVPYCDMDHPDMAVYYIADGKLSLPQVTRRGTTLTFTCKYRKSIDMFVCTNLAGVYQLKAGIGTYIDNPYSNRCYVHIVADEDPGYPIDARFYPCVMADKDLTIRVFTENMKYIPHPELTRLLTYPEFAHIADPYNCDDAFLNQLKPVTVSIVASDDDEIILQKFNEIAPYCYRIYEDFPRFCNEQSDFLVLDNIDFGKQNFEKRTVKYLDGTSEEAIVCRCPYEDYRDILFYGNYMFSKYRVIQGVLVKDAAIEAKFGMQLYIISGDYKPELFTLLKFNAAEDTVISNIGDFIDKDNMLQLHTRLNRFYRNLLVLRGSVIDSGGRYSESDSINSVRISTTEPETKDSHLWFELLVNAIPEQFEQKSDIIIKSFGLDISDIPEELRSAVYSLDLPEDGGPAYYTKLLYTYFDMAERHKNQLVVQHQAGEIGDPRYAEFDYLIHGPVDTSQPGEFNVMHWDTDIGKKEIVREYEESINLLPEDDKVRKEGDLLFGMDPGVYPPGTPTDPDEPVDPDIGNILDGVFTDQDIISLDTISYIDTETGRAISGDVVRAMSIDEKIKLVTGYITEGTDEEKENTKKLWLEYMQTMDEDTLDIAVYKILLTDYAYHSGLENARPDTPEKLEFEESPYVVQPDVPENPTTGLYWVQLDSKDPIVIHETVKKNLHYIFSAKQPTKAEIGTYWIDVPAVCLQDYVEEILSIPLMEIGATLPEGIYKRLTDREDEASTVIDYGAHGQTGGGAPLFNEVKDESLHPVRYGDEIFAHEPRDGDVWYEFLDEIDNKVCYSDENSMVIRIDERLILLKFEHDNITAFAFDDIVLNFKGSLGIRYIAILADLINSHVIDRKDINIFYRRLVTGNDIFEPGLQRLYTGRSYIIATPLIDSTQDLSITYSSNIGRYRIDYTNKENVSNKERESAYRHVIDYSHRDIAFIQDRMLLFVNGRYIPRMEYEEIAAGKVKLKNFHELIDYVDIFYSKKDEALSKLKKIAISHWGAEDTSTSIQKPIKNRYHHMKPIHVCEHTLMGYYDVLMNDYIFNGKLLRVLRYAIEHPDEKQQIINDFKRKFHAITDYDRVGMNFDESRIIIPGFGHGYKYEIKGGEQK